MNIFFGCIILLCIVNFTFQSMVKADHWVDYRIFWTEGVCATGHEQSPIDIVTLGSTSPDGEYIHYWHHSEHHVLQQVTWNIRNGANFYISQTPKGESGSMYTTLKDFEYKWDLRNIHMHIPSEHTVNGHRYDMELHFIHDLDLSYSRGNNPFGNRKATVVGVFFEIDNFEGDAVIDEWSFEQNSEFDFEVPHFLDNHITHYLYNGGLTTPGCDEVVNWIVIAQPFKIHARKFRKIESILHNIYPDGNARVEMPLNDRKIYSEGN